MKANLKPVTKAHPCRVCQGDHKCSVGEDGLIMCGRCYEKVAGFVLMGKAEGDEQFSLYREKDDPALNNDSAPYHRNGAAKFAPKSSSSKRGQNGKAGVDWEARVKEHAARMGAAARTRLADVLGLPERVLGRLRIGCGQDRDGGFYSFPEYDGEGSAIGIVRRYEHPPKMAMPGGNRGLTIPDGWDNFNESIFVGYVLYLVEGPSDVLACCSIGLCSIGRPSNRGGVDHIVKLLSKLPKNRRPLLVVVGEHDTKADGSWPGREGAISTAKALTAKLGKWPVRWVLPPAGFKDIREWVRAQNLPADNADAWKAAGDKLGKALEEKYRQVGEAGPNATARAPEPYRPFPVDALPDPIRRYVVQGAASIGCDPVYVALPAMSVAAGLIGNSRTIRIKRDWFEPSVVWTGIVGDSGTLKTPAVSAAVGPLYRLQRSLLQKHKDDLGDYEREKTGFEARKKKAKELQKEFTEPPPDKPKPARVVSGDITIECLAGLLADNPKGLTVCRDELGGWLGSFSRYKGKAGGSDLPNWLELSRAGTIQVDRKTGDRPMLFIPHAAVSICGGIQPGALTRAMTPEYMEAGLGARFLMAMPPKRRKTWSEAEIDPSTSDAYEKLLGSLRDLSLDRDKDGGKVPFAVRMTPAAKAAWVAFYTEWAAEQANADGDMAAALSKLEGYAARLALIHHIVTHVGDMTDSEPIEPISIEAGVALVRWFAAETRRIYATLRESDDEKNLRKLIEFIRAHGGEMTGRRLHQSNKSRYPDTETAEATLNELAAAGLGEWTGNVASPKGGRPSRTLILKPDATYSKSYETSADEDDIDGDCAQVAVTGLATEPNHAVGNQAKNDGFVASEACSTMHGLSTNGETTPSADQTLNGDGRGVSEHGANLDSSKTPSETQSPEADATAPKATKPSGEETEIEEDSL
jgi:hypothetical protein